MKSFFTLLLAVFATILFAQQPGTVDKSYGNSNGAEIVKGAAGIMFSSAIQTDDKLITGGANSSLNNYLLLSRHNKDGSMDSSFGTNGTVSSIYDPSIYVLGFGNGWISIAIQPDGKIVCTGIGDRSGPGGDTLYNTDILVARFLPDGTPDNSFGTNGVEITNIGYTELSSAIALQPDGKIVVGGQFNNKLLVLRYNTDGTPDSTFGGIGYVLSTAIISTAQAIAVQPDGKIVAGGSYNINRYFFTERFLPDGTVDNSFGQNGSVTTAVSDGPFGIFINSLALDGTGRIVASGNAVFSDGTNQIAVVRYLPDGTLDNSFDGDGKKYIAFTGNNGFNYSTAVLLPNPYKIIVAGYTITVNPNFDFALAALNTDGSVDSTFGTNGQTTADFGYDEVTYGAVLQSDGKIVLTASDLYDIPFPYIDARFIGYPVQVSLTVRIKRFLHNHGITWNGLPEEDKITYYSVEQSASSRRGFSQVAKVSGRSNLKDYSITNSNLLQGMNYYRVKAVSTDGTIRYSEVVSADNTANTASVYPNPARDYVTVQDLPTNTTANISIADGSGNVMAKGVSNGGTQYRSPLNNMQPGTYYINITTGSKTEVIKFVKE